MSTGSITECLMLCSLHYWHALWIKSLSIVFTGQWKTQSCTEGLFIMFNTKSYCDSTEIQNQREETVAAGWMEGHCISTGTGERDWDTKGWFPGHRLCLVLDRFSIEIAFKSRTRCNLCPGSRPKERSNASHLLSKQHTNCSNTQPYS